jgi:hypothetical protein
MDVDMMTESPRSLKISIQCLAFLALLCSCAPVMEATRPDPVDLSQFVPGENRLNVIAEVGNPLATEKDGKQSCDVYKLFTHGPEAAGKGAIAAGEAVADVFTLGLTEVVFTPAEAATRNSKHTVIFCYENNKLVSVKESDTHVDQ